MSYHLLEKAFRDDRGEPIVSYRQPMNAKEMTLVSINEDEADWKDSTTRILLGERRRISWSVSQSAYPVTIQDTNRVKVLARSWDLGRIFDGEQSDTVFLRFPYGRGQVVHLVSHWYDQHFDSPAGPSDRPPPSRTMVFETLPPSGK
jgi:hypothetical protein